MKKGEQIMKSTARLMTPQAMRLAVLTLAITAALGTPAIAKSVNSQAADTSASINRSAPARPAAKPAAPARTNMARPAQSAARPAAAARPNVSRPAPASRPSAGRPEAAHSSARPAAPHSTAGRESHPTVAHGGEHPGRPEAHGAPGARNASYSHGDNLHGGNRIAEDRFRGSFGRGHQFHIGHPVMIGGQASFQFGGLWFGMVDPWPAAWLYTDAVYVDFINGGYVLVNVVHPEVQVAVSAGDAATGCTTADPVVPAAPVVAAPVAVVPVVVAPVPYYTYVTWHYWRHYWR
jgi:hypothetical protein